MSGPCPAPGSVRSLVVGVSLEALCRDPVLLPALRVRWSLGRRQRRGVGTLSRSRLCAFVGRWGWQSRRVGTRGHHGEFIRLRVQILMQALGRLWRCDGAGPQ